MIVRQLFSRLVFSLQIESSLSMEIIAFWLWLEGNGHADFLECIDSFGNNQLRAIAFAGKSFIEALYLRSSESNDTSTQESYFYKEASEGVTFYLNKFCYKALEDIREIAETKERICHINQPHEEKMKDKVPMSTKDLLSKIKASYTNTPEEGTSSRSMQSPKSHILQYSIDGRQSTYHLANLLDTLSLKDTPNDIQKQQHSSVPRDERTLFVTFSNGYPFTKDELYDFFMRHFGDVEEISVEEPIESRPPLYAHVTFFSQVTLFQVLDGNKKVKFMTRGKHIWARQFVPKRKKVEN
ncbi:uncharacterized protein LOC133890549 [Phragmites australis]|uniref:uncharacterized protein LOC133890549 n=1 Tax=Phragmites australis TaxID=29695 RepID=UPI002D793A6B|nr:uncharacterized protein LOC133890549 [Phragmites australis]